MSTESATALSRVDLLVGEEAVTLSGHRGEYLFEQVRSAGRFYEADLLDTIVRTVEVQDDSLIVDVGANIGNHSLYLLAAFPRARLLAIEPVPANVEILRHNIAENGFTDRSEVADFAAWSRSGTVHLTQSIEGNSGAFHAAEAADGVRAAPLDDVVPSAAPVALIKIDVEGSEGEVLRGAGGILGTHRPAVVAEAHTAALYRVIEDILRPLGYRACGLGGRSDTFVWATEPTAGRVEREAQLMGPRSRWRATQSALQRLSAGTERAERELAEVQDALAGRAVSAAGQHEELLASLSGAADRSEEGVRALLESVRRSGDEVQDVVLQAQQRNDQLVRDWGRRATREQEDHGERLAEHHRHQAEQVGRLERLGRDTAERVERLAGDQEGGLADLRRTGAEALALLREGERRRAMRRSAAARLLREAPAREESWTDAIEGSTRALLDADLLTGGVEAVRRGIREVGAGEVDDTRVRIGMATIPERAPMLELALRSLAPQADEIFVYLNGSEDAPEHLSFGGKVRFFTGPDLGDRAKFVFLEGFDGYYLTCDDDIVYPTYYVEHIRAGIERYGREAVVGWHASHFLPSFDRYYDKGSRRVLTYYANVAADEPVHLLGTGIAGFHTQARPLRLEDCRLPNMADVWLAARCQDQGIPMVLLAHEAKQAMPIDRDAPSISLASMGKAEQAPRSWDVGDVVSELVRHRMPWSTHTALSRIEATVPLRVAVLGRTDRERWRKGGILKSCHLLADGLRAGGAAVVLEDVQTGDPEGLHGAEVDVVLFYVADPRRPDFAQIERLVEHHSRCGRIVLINLSIQGEEHRDDYVVRQLQQWERDLPTPVYGMVFTQAAFNDRAYDPIRHRLVVIPKTVVGVDQPAPRYTDTHGIFLGDIAKLSDPALIGGPGAAWVDAARAALPGVPLYGVQQYRPAHPVDFELDEVWQHADHDTFFASVRRARVMVSPTRHATYEMVPVEVAALGLPVVYRRMPWSLSESIGAAGVQVETPEDLLEVLPTLYYEPAVWHGLSRAGRERTGSQTTARVNAQINLQIQRVVAHHRR